MIIDKDTGDLVISDDLRLKAGMSFDEVKNSKLRELLDEENPDEGFHLLFKPLKVANEEVIISTFFITERMSIINLYLNVGEEPYANFKLSEAEFQQVIIQHQEFLQKILQTDIIDYQNDFSWGQVELDVDHRERTIMIAINYIW
ncbi:MAG TPA: hypothetical protein PLZ08_12655 [Bacillota bacterium]|jgi:hypothetical protein|nr:hypothetical protein [Bacillota bacterium]HPO98788.1 hypothetical protein [Bacillota bacterium]